MWIGDIWPISNLLNKVNRYYYRTESKICADSELHILLLKIICWKLRIILDMRTCVDTY